MFNQKMLENKSLLISVLILTIGLFYTCERKRYYGDVDCKECYRQKPDSADLIIHITVNDDFKNVPFTVYRGKVEDNNIEYSGVADTNMPYYVYVPADKTYSVKATYTKGDTTIYAIDGTKLKVLLVTDACDADCYVIRNADIYVNLRYSF